MGAAAPLRRFLGSARSASSTSLAGRRGVDNTDGDIVLGTSVVGRVRSKREWIASGRCGSWSMTSHPASSHTTE